MCEKGRNEKRESAVERVVYPAGAGNGSNIVKTWLVGFVVARDSSRGSGAHGSAEWANE